MFTAKIPGTHYASLLLYNNIIQIEITFANGNQFLLLLLAFLTIWSVDCGKCFYLITYIVDNHLWFLAELRHYFTDLHCNGEWV